MSSSGTGEGGQQQPEVKRIANCHQGGCNAISWGPSVPPSALLSNDASFEVSQRKTVEERVLILKTILPSLQKGEEISLQGTIFVYA